MKNKIKTIIKSIIEHYKLKKKIRELKKELKTLNDGYDELENNYLALKKQYDEDLMTLTIKSHERALKYKQERIDYLRKENKELYEIINKTNKLMGDKLGDK